MSGSCGEMDSGYKHPPNHSNAVARGSVTNSDISAGAITPCSCHHGQLSHSSQLLPAFQGLQFPVFHKRRSEAQCRNLLDVIAHEGGCGAAPSSEFLPCRGTSASPSPALPARQARSLEALWGKWLCLVNDSCVSN